MSQQRAIDLTKLYHHYNKRKSIIFSGRDFGSLQKNTYWDHWRRLNVTIVIFVLIVALYALKKY